MFSRALQKEIASALERREQIILFLNRRGASTFVMCRDCGAVIRCPQCDIPLTYHLQGKALTCHHCGYQRAVPTQCPICASHMIKHFGVGTQRVKLAVRQTFPHARVLRWDSDTTTEKGSHRELLDQFSRHNADILIGTQMVAKGLDLPMVTLVGVISADTALHLPDFRAAERTFQLLAQVAGRAGRGPRGGKVIIQTYTPEHYAIQCASRHSYRDFYRQERRYRRELGYPPFSRLARLVYSDANNVRCRQAAADLAAELEEHLHRQPEAHISLIGPAPCFLSRLRGRWRWQIILREEPPGTALRRLLSHISLSPGWHLDIDPLNML